MTHLCPGFLRSAVYYRFLSCLSVTILLLSACSAAKPGQSVSSPASIGLQDLPEGIGRGFATATLADRGNTGNLRKGATPPNFYLTLEDGRSLSLQSLRGQPVLINFWASWCGPCRLEMPDIIRHANDNPDLVVLAVNVEEPLEAIQPFAEEFQMSLPVVRDSDGALRDLYEVHGLPTSVFIDRRGRIFTIWPGPLTADLLQEILRDMG